MGAPTTLARKLTSTARDYKSQVDDLLHAALGARPNAKKTDLLTDLRTTAWWEGRYVILLELYERGHVSDAVLVEYANKMPGRKVTAAPPAPKPALSVLVPSPQPQLARPSRFPWRSILTFSFLLLLSFLALSNSR